jgi:DNA-binding protein HU-beta
MEDTNPWINLNRKRMTQSEVINHFADKLAIKRTEAKRLFDELGNLAQNEVKQNNEFNLPGFGKLVLAERKAREGRNPSTGESIQIPAKTILKFRVGKSLKDKITGAELPGDSDPPIIVHGELAGDPSTGDEP